MTDLLSVRYSESMSKEMVISGVVLGIVLFALVYLWDRFIPGASE